jgi:hypothetical protein
MKSQIVLVRLLLPVCLLAGAAPLALAQSNNESQPTQVTGNRIKEGLDTQQGSTAYHYLLRLNAGRNQAVLNTEFECGGSISIYLDGQPGFFPASSNTVGSSNRCKATAEYSFVLNQPKNVLVTIYLASIPNDKFNVDLSFSGGTESLATGKPDLLKTCTYSDNFSVSDLKPRYERVYKGLVFKKGSAQMFITARNNEGTNISGTVYAEQTDRGQYNQNMVLPADGFGGTIGTPLENAPVREAQSISGNGKGNIRILLEQNGNGVPKTGSYKLVVKGDAIVNCGSSSR